MSRPIREYRTTSKENFKRFCEEHPNIDLTIDEWKNIQFSYIDLFREHILETGNKEKLPAGWGPFSIAKLKRKKIITFNGKDKVNLPIDWQKSKEKGKRIYNFNYHSEGYSFKWLWFRESAMFKQSKLWYFKPCRLTSRLIAHYIKADEKYQHIYLEWPKNRY